MSGAAKFLRSLIIGQPMSRRDFLTGTASTAASAAASRVPLPVAATQAETTARALNHADILPAAFHRGFDLPAGAYIVGRDGKAMIWGYDGGFKTKQEIEQLEAIAREAAAALSKMPGSAVPMHYNYLTKQWHAMGTFDETPEGYRRSTYLKHGVLPPAGREQGDWNVFDEDFASAAYSEGTLTQPGLASVNHRAVTSKPIKAREAVSGELINQPVPPTVISGDPTKRVKTQIDGIREEWEGSQRAIAEYYRTNPPKDDYGREMRRQVNENMGYTPGGWHNVGPDPFPVDEMNITGMEPLPGSERPNPQSATTLRNIRRMLGIAAPVAAGAAAQDQKQGPVTSEVLR